MPPAPTSARALAGTTERGEKRGEERKGGRERGRDGEAQKERESKKDRQLWNPLQIVYFNQLKA